MHWQCDHTEHYRNNDPLMSEIFGTVHESVSSDRERLSPHPAQSADRFTILTILTAALSKNNIYHQLMKYEPTPGKVCPQI
jgi:hypothetical protein